MLLYAAIMFTIGCEEDDNAGASVTLDAGALSGGPFTFAVDGVPDMVSGITLADFDGNGDTQTYVVTDDAESILGVPPNLGAVEGVDFDGAGIGVCLI